jgi:tetratricopeptide (TPR) repeat protein
LTKRDHARAIRLCDERLAVDKANAADLQRLRCQLLLASGDLDQARQGYAAVLATRDTPWARLGMAKVMYQGGDFAGAKQMLEATIGDNSAFLEAYDWLAKTQQATGEIEAAGQTLERAARLSPNSVLRQKTLGEVALKLGNLDGAERAFRKSVSLGEHSVLKKPCACSAVSTRRSTPKRCVCARWRSKGRCIIAAAISNWPAKRPPNSAKNWPPTACDPAAKRRSNSPAC